MQHFAPFWRTGTVEATKLDQRQSFVPDDYYFVRLCHGLNMNKSNPSARDFP